MANLPSDADVRAAVDSIVRRVATFDWLIAPTIEPQNENYGRAVEISEAINKWLQTPNKNGDTWQDLWTAALTDLLVYDASALELVYDANEMLREIVALKGSSIRPVVDEYGNVLEYQQDLYGDIGYQTFLRQEEDLPTFQKDQMVYLRLFPTTATPLGNPLIEALVNEVITLLRGSEHTMLALDADEIPPGILVLAGVAGQAAREARSDLMKMRGQDHKIRVLTTPDPTAVGARWVELRHTPKDLEFSQIIQEVRRTCWRVFGVMPVEMGASDSMPRATAQVQLDVASSHLVTPVLELLQARINTAIIPEVAKTVGATSEELDWVTFHWDRESRMSAEDSKFTADRLRMQIETGVMTRNEARAELGLLPIQGGDVVTVKTPYGPLPLADVLTGGSLPEWVADEEEAPQTDVTAVASRAAIDDVSKAVAKNLKEKASTHNEKVGDDDRKRTTPNVLAKVFNRGVGAYHTNPESVRPSVTSPEQWAYGRVNSFLYALEKLKFRRGKHDTDLLPKSHPLHTEKVNASMANRSVVRGIDLPLASMDTPWGWDAGANDVVLGDPPNWSRYAEAHLWYDASESNSKSGYKFPVAKMIDGELKIVFRGVASVVGALKEDGKHESLEGVTLEEQRRVYDLVKSLYERFDREPPVIDRLETEMVAATRAVGDVDPTNFPKTGDNLKVSLRNSQYPVFDPEFAEMIRLEYPEIWDRGGNVLGNTQYRRLTPVVGRGGVVETETEELAVRLREAWAARHLEDFRLAGTIAQIKWYVVGDRGEQYMKDLVRAEMEKIDGNE